MTVVADAPPIVLVDTHLIRAQSLAHLDQGQTMVLAGLYDYLKSLP